MSDLSPASLSRIARNLYADGPTFRRTVQGHRPLICPFGPLIEAVPQGARLLDGGCGSGLFLGLLAHLGCISFGHGFDASREAIALAERMKERHPEGHRLLFECRGAEEPWPEGEFDVVSVIDLIHHVAPGNQAEVIRKAASRVRRGGLFLYKDMTRRPRWRVLASVLHDLVLARQWFHIPSFEAAAEAAGACGLIARERAVHNMFWYGHEIGVFQRPE